MAKKTKRQPDKSLPASRRKKIKSKTDRKISEHKKDPEETVKNIKIRVIGLGGGAGNIISEIASKISKASFVAANTDAKSLKSCAKKVIKFQFGHHLTKGLGTGMNAEIGEAAAREEKEKIKKLCQNQDLCILVACLGGGTGTGAINTFAKMARESGSLTYRIFTLPFRFEGEKKTELAVDSLKKTKHYLNALTIIPNERVFQIIDKNTPLKEALSAINKFLCQSLSGLIETLYRPGLINIDFADFKTILDGRGRLAYLSAVEVPKKEEAVKDLTEKVLGSPLYPYGIRGSKGVIFNIIGKKNLLLSEVKEISKAISQNTHPEAKIIFGVSQAQKSSNLIKTVLLATGCQMKVSWPDRNKTIGKRAENAKNKKRLKRRPDPRPSAPEKEPESEKIAPSSGQSEKNETKANKPAPVTTAKKTAKIKKQTSKDKVSEKEKTKTDSADGSRPEKKSEKEKQPSSPVAAESVRKNGLQLKREIEEMEKEMLEKEKIWERPAFLRKKITDKGQNN